VCVYICVCGCIHVVRAQPWVSVLPSVLLEIFSSFTAQNSPACYFQTGALGFQAWALLPLLCVFIRLVQQALYPELCPQPRICLVYLSLWSTLSQFCIKYMIRRLSVLIIMSHCFRTVCEQDFSSTELLLQFKNPLDTSVLVCFGGLCCPVLCAYPSVCTQAWLS